MLGDPPCQVTELGVSILMSAVLSGLGVCLRALAKVENRGHFPDPAARTFIGQRLFVMTAPSA